MQKWEYCEVYDTGQSPWTKYGVFYRSNGDVSTQVEGKTARQVVAELGQEGWEAYAVKSVSYASTDSQFFLKRQMP